MASNPPKTTWDSLAKDLGVEPTPEAFERHQPSDVELSLTAGPEVEPPQTAPSDWKVIAGDLGVDIEPDSSVPASKQADVSEGSAAIERPAVPATETGPSGAEDSLLRSGEVDLGPMKGLQDESAAAESRESSTSDDLANSADASDPGDSPDSTPDSANDNPVAEKNLLGMTGDAARSAFDALFSIGASAWGSAIRENPLSGEPRELESSEDTSENESSVGDLRPDDALAPGDGPAGRGVEGVAGVEGDPGAAAPAGNDESGEGQSPTAKRKRPRRRRGGRRSRRDGGTPGERAAAGQGSQADELLDGKEGFSEETGGSEGAKRPRRRRGRRRPRAEGAEQKTPRQPKSESVGSLADGLDLDDLGADEANYSGAAPREDASAMGEESGSTVKSRTSHRNLPTWSDAIGVIVDANLELHSKSPRRPDSSRSRGGRSRGGRSRGGRSRGGRGRGGSLNKS